MVYINEDDDHTVYEFFHFYILLRVNFGPNQDGWALKWIYLACMENTIFEITEWGNCQSGSLRHLKPNVHAVQYKLKPWNASNGTPNQEQRKNTCQDPTDLR